MGKRESQSDHEKKLFLLCDAIFGKDDRAREERLELATYLLRRDIQTFSELDHAQVCRLLDACEGYELITELKRQRPD